MPRNGWNNIVLYAVIYMKGPIRCRNTMMNDQINSSDIITSMIIIRLNVRIILD